MSRIGRRILTKILSFYRRFVRRSSTTSMKTVASDRSGDIRLEEQQPKHRSEAEDEGGEIEVDAEMGTFLESGVTKAAFCRELDGLLRRGLHGQQRYIAGR